MTVCADERCTGEARSSRYEFDASIVRTLDSIRNVMNIPVTGGFLPDRLPDALELLTLTMHRKWASGSIDEAIALAKAIAPYTHAKPISGQRPPELAAMRDEQLDEFCRLGSNRASTSNPRTR